MYERGWLILYGYSMRMRMKISELCREWSDCSTWLEAKYLQRIALTAQPRSVSILLLAQLEKATLGTHF